MRNRALSRVMLVALFGSVVGLTALQSQDMPAKPCAGPEYRQFDFWIGEWDVTANGKAAGTNRIEAVAGDCGLQENWTGAGGSTGRSLNAYSPQDGKWHQTWLGSGGLWMPLSGGLRGTSMVLEGQTLDREKHVVHQRITWTPQPDGRVRQLWEQSKDGKTWSAAFDGMYRRK